jgi:hypothetical protein
VWIVADPASAQPADSLAIRHIPSADAYLVPRALVADYVVCAAEVEALRAVEAEAVRTIAAQDSLGLVLRERSEATRGEASACGRALDLSEGRGRALGAEAEHWRTEAVTLRQAARSAERQARWWRTVALVAGGAGVVAALLR